ncbi:MAG TPA: DUF4416 family protein, partial [Nitrospiraceae bacterium]|nr:DUF4416 family protein [Nitrospiraceae bacterium]
MGIIQQPRPALLFLAAFSRHEQALTWAREKAEVLWGPVALQSDPYDFNFTTFYDQSMGTELRKVFFAFDRLIDSAMLIQLKHAANELEEQFRSSHRYPELRPLNLDPGYVTEAKLVLASTKDRDHRIYLGNGIYAEGTLYFNQRQWRTRPWTYPDYQTATCHEFLNRCRDYLRRKLATE